MPLPPGAPDQRRIALVLGMNRSGTSAATRALNFERPSPPRRPAGTVAGQPDDYWEPRGGVLLHDEILQAAGLDWRSTRVFPHSWFETEHAGQFRDRLWQAIEPDLPAEESLLVKDPRLCRLLPLWRRLAAEHAPVLHNVLMVHNPLEVATSLARRDAMPPAEALQLRLLLRRENAALHCRQRNVLREREVLAATVDALHASRSWRLTAPLRVHGRIVKR